MNTIEPKPPQTNFEKVISNAKETLIRKREHIPTVIVEGQDDLATGYLPDMPELHEEKLEYMQLLGQLVKANCLVGELRQVFIIAQGFMWEDDNAIYVDISTSQDHAGEEILITSGVQLEEHRKHLNILAVLRDQEHQVIGFLDLLSKTDGVPLETPLEDAFINGFQGVQSE